MVETELVRIGCRPLQGCKACSRCYENQNKECIIGSDSLNEFVQKMIEADGIILASPTYFADVTAEMKAFIDRCGMIGKANGDLFQCKVDATVISMRRAGAIHALDTINHFFLTSQMIIPVSSYWNVGLGSGLGGVEDDEEGFATMELLSHNMAWLLKKIHS